MADYCIAFIREPLGRSGQTVESETRQSNRTERRRWEGPLEDKVIYSWNLDDVLQVPSWPVMLVLASTKRPSGAISFGSCAARALS